MSRHDPIYTEECNGKTIKIMPDDSGSESPIAGDESVVMAVLHRKYINPAAKTTVEDSNGNSFKLTTIEEIAAFEAQAKDWTVFKLFLYDHSGTSYQPSETGNNPFTCPWDSGRVGVIALKTANFGEGDGNRAHLFQIAKDLCSDYTAWANGEVYGYVVEDSTGHETDACWGFYGDPEGYVLEEARAAAKT